MIHQSTVDAHNSGDCNSDCPVCRLEASEPTEPTEIIEVAQPGLSTYHLAERGWHGRMFTLTLCKRSIPRAIRLETTEGLQLCPNCMLLDPREIEEGE